jgi:hypothetical protein
MGLDLGEGVAKNQGLVEEQSFFSSQHFSAQMGSNLQPFYAN